MSDKLYLVTLSCRQHEFFAYTEMVTSQPVASLIALRKHEKEKRKTSKHPQPFREFHIVNIVEATTEEAEHLAPPPPPTLAQMKAMFDKFAMPKPDAVVEVAGNPAIVYNRELSSDEREQLKSDWAEANRGAS